MPVLETHSIMHGHSRRRSTSRLFYQPERNITKYERRRIKKEVRYELKKEDCLAFELCTSVSEIRICGVVYQV